MPPEVLKLEDFFENSPHPMCVIDLKTLAFLEVNTAVLKKYGYTRAEFQKKKLFDIFSSCDTQSIKQIENIQKTIKPDSVFEIENSIHCKKNKDTFHVHTYIHLVKFNKTTHNLVMYFTDISEQKKLQAQMLISEQNLRGLIDNTNDFIWSVDRDLNIISINNSFKYLVYGVTGKMPVAGEKISWEPYSKEFSDRWINNYKTALAGIRLKVVDEEVLNNHKFHRETCLSPIQDEKGNIIGVSCFSRDIDGEKQYLEKIQEQNRRLKEIAWLQSHKVRNHVATILGLTQLFDYDSIDMENKKILKHFEEVTYNLDSVIKEIDEKTRATT